MIAIGFNFTYIIASRYLIFVSLIFFWGFKRHFLDFSQHFVSLSDRRLVWIVRGPQIMYCPRYIAGRCSYHVRDSQRYRGQILSQDAHLPFSPVAMCCCFSEGEQSPLTYHLNHTEPWPVQRRQTSSYLESPPEEYDSRQESKTNPHERNASPLVSLPWRDGHQDPHQLGPTGLHYVLVLKVSTCSPCTIQKTQWVPQENSPPPEWQWGWETDSYFLDQTG